MPAKWTADGREGLMLQEAPAGSPSRRDNRAEHFRMDWEQTPGQVIHSC